MGGGMKFLMLKSWHPSNNANQKLIWIAEQKAKAKEQSEKDAAVELKKAADLYRFQKIAASKGDEQAARQMEAQSVEFMYALPPGLLKVDDVEKCVREDDAAQEFRRRIEDIGKGDTKDTVDEAQRNLERYVGRKPVRNPTISEQVERFPMLKDAPVEGDYTSSVKVNFKPVGVQLRNVRCLRCGDWGHYSGDRECKMRDYNPHDAARQAIEDPLSYMNKVAHDKKHGLMDHNEEYPLEMKQRSNGAYDEYELLSPEEAEASETESEFLAKLTTKEKKFLLRKIRKASKKEKRLRRSRSNDKIDKTHKRKKESRKNSKDERRKSRNQTEEGDKRSHSRLDRRGRSRSRSRPRGQA